MRWGRSAQKLGRDSASTQTRRPHLASCHLRNHHLTHALMEPRIATLLDQSPYKRLTLDPSVLTTHTSNAHRYIEPTASANAAHSNLDSLGHYDHVDPRTRTSSHAQSSAPLARVLNGPSSASHVHQASSGRRTPQHATFLTGSDGSGLGASTLSPDARRREEQHNSAPYSGGDTSLIQLPKPPQVPRKTAKRPRIPPLLQGLHQPPPLPPKNRLFPPITSDRSGLGSDVSDRFSLGNTYSTSSTEELAKARVISQKTSDIDYDDEERAKSTNSSQNAFENQRLVSRSTTEPKPTAETANRALSKAKAPRKRTRWSQKETDDLLTGVSRFGIGRWKQILECTDFQFQGRTAVDLKDRFRVCRPGEGLKARKAITPEAAMITHSTAPSQTDSEVRAVSAIVAVIHTAPSVPRTPLEVLETVNDATISKVGVHGPFMKSRRRARREFSDEDDKNLLKGFKRHGAAWHKMRDDFELGFGMRHPTDLRDRFRIRFPDLFAQAGYKLKAKEQRALEERTEETRSQEAQASKQPAKRTSQLLDSTSRTVTRTSTAKASSAPAPAPKSKSTTTRPTFELTTDLTFSSSSSDGDRSPIVLNRNILQWADENSNSNSTSAPSTTTAAPPSSQAPPHTSMDLFNPFAASDGLHINPLATLKLPSTAHWGYMYPPPAPSLPPPAPLKHTLPTSSTGAGMGNGMTNGTPASGMASGINNGMASGMNSGITSSSTRAQQEMRTPNLPNIVFPYVPNASARNAVLNLPAPADILSSGGQGQAQGIGMGQGQGQEGWLWIG